MTVEDAVRGACYGFAVAEYVVGQADARLNVVVVWWNALHNSQGLVCGTSKRGGGALLGQELHVVTDAIVQRQPRRHAPRVLNERSQRVVIESQMRISYALHQVLWQRCAIGLDGGDGWRALAHRDQSEVVDASEVDSEVSRQRDQVVVDSK